MPTTYDDNTKYDEDCFSYVGEYDLVCLLEKGFITKTRGKSRSKREEIQIEIRNLSINEKTIDNTRKISKPTKKNISIKIDKVKIHEE